MKKLSSIIIDDEPSAHKVLVSYCKQDDMLDLKGSFLNAREALDFIKEVRVELIFLDVNMPEINGFEFINQLDYNPAIILTTAYGKHAVKSYEFKVVDFLVKPVRPERFKEAVEKAKILFENNIYQYQADKFFEIKHRNGTILIPIEEIMYVQSIGNYVKIFSRKGNHILHVTMTEVERKLRRNNFVRIHKSYIVNASCIKKIEGLKMSLNDIELPIGKTYVKFLSEKIR